MSTETNKAIMRGFFKSLEAADINAISELIDEHVHWWVQGKGELNKAAFCQNTAQIFSMTKHRVAIIDQIIAENNTVHLQVSTHFTFHDDRVLHNTMSLTVSLENGLIMRSVEFMDIDQVRAFFAPSL